MKAHFSLNKKIERQFFSNFEVIRSYIFRTPNSVTCHTEPKGSAAYTLLRISTLNKFLLRAVNDQERFCSTIFLMFGWTCEGVFVFKQDAHVMRKHNINKKQFFFCLFFTLNTTPSLFLKLYGVSRYVRMMEINIMQGLD